jgi:hypothetical protein
MMLDALFVFISTVNALVKNDEMTEVFLASHKQLGSLAASQYPNEDQSCFYISLTTVLFVPFLSIFLRDAEKQCV